MRKLLLSTLALTLATAGAASAQGRSDVQFVGGTGNAVVANAVVVGDMIYLSGQQAGRNGGSTVEEQTRGALENIKKQLEPLGATMDDVVKCTVYMADLSERPKLNEVYATYFPNHRPARSAVGVDLGGPKVEIECMAVKPQR